VARYAYAKQRITKKKKILPSEGLLGSMHLEQDFRLLSDCSSQIRKNIGGLGERATPRAVIVAPLIF